MSARHAVAGDQLVPANLRIARVVRPPCQFGFPVARIAGQVTVIVGHGRTGVVPPQGAVFPHPVFGPGSHVEPGRGRQPHAVRSGGQRHELAPHARIADFAVLETPGRIVEVVARKAESLFDRRKACAPYRRRDNEEESQRMALAQMPGGTESRRQGIREDAFDVHVAPRTGVESRRTAPAAAARVGGTKVPRALRRSRRCVRHQHRRWPRAMPRSRHGALPEPRAAAANRNSGTKSPTRKRRPPPRSNAARGGRARCRAD